MASDPGRDINAAPMEPAVPAGETVRSHASMPPGMGQPVEAKTSGVAVISLVLGILGCVPPLSLIAIILGIVAQSHIGTSQGRLKGSGMAVAGITLGTLGLLVSLVAMPIVILIPALGAARQAALQIQGHTQTRGIQQSMVIYGQTNNKYYPGLDRDGNVLTADAEPDYATLPAGEDTGATTANRFHLLLTDDYISGEFCISPNDMKTPFDPFGTGNVTTANFTYAMRAFNPNAGGPSAWHVDDDSTKQIVGDRRIGNGTGYRSIHTSPPANVTDWQGYVAFNDGMAQFMPTDPAGLVDLNGRAFGTLMAYSTSNQSD